MHSLTNSDTIQEDSSHVAIFVDLLGVSSLYEQKEERELLRRLEIFQSYHHKDIEEAGTFQQNNSFPSYKHFSDSLYVSIPSNGIKHINNSPYDYYGFYLSDIAFMQGQMAIEEGIFMRGGIYRGKCLRGATAEVSQAYYEAYKLESKAFYPIIAVMPELGGEIPEMFGKQAYAYLPPNEELLYFYENDSNKLYFLNYLCRYIDYCLSCLSNPTEERQNKLIFECLLKHKNNIITEYKSFSKKHDLASLEIKIKYCWLAYEYHNKIVKKYNIEVPKLLIRKDEILAPTFLQYLKAEINFHLSPSNVFKSCYILAKKRTQLRSFSK